MYLLDFPFYVSMERRRKNRLVNRSIGIPIHPSYWKSKFLVNSHPCGRVTNSEQQTRVCIYCGRDLTVLLAA